MKELSFWAYQSYIKLVDGFLERLSVYELQLSAVLQYDLRKRAAGLDLRCEGLQSCTGFYSWDPLHMAETVARFPWQPGIFLPVSACNTSLDMQHNTMHGHHAPLSVRLVTLNYLINQLRVFFATRLNYKIYIYILWSN